MNPPALYTHQHHNKTIISHKQLDLLVPGSDHFQMGVERRSLNHGINTVIEIVLKLNRLAIIFQSFNPLAGLVLDNLADDPTPNFM